MDKMAENKEPKEKKPRFPMLDSSHHPSYNKLTPLSPADHIRSINILLVEKKTEKRKKKK